MKGQKRVSGGLRILCVIVILIVLALFAPWLVTEINNRMEQMKTEYDILLNHPDFTVLESTPIRIKAKIVVEEDNLPFPLNVPCSKNWKVQIDGKNEAIIKNGDAAMALNIDSGAHILEIQYQLKEVMMVLGIFVVVAVLLICLLVKKNKKVIPETEKEDEEMQVIETAQAVEEASTVSDDDLWEFKA